MDYMISSDFIIIRTRPVAFCTSAIRLITSSLAFGTGVTSSWNVVVGKVSKLRVTIFTVTFFYSDMRVRTPTFTNAWILSLRTKYLLVGCYIILWKR